jgi:hypothetical protein
MPFDVAARRVPKDMGQSVPLVIVQFAGLPHVLLLISYSAFDTFSSSRRLGELSVPRSNPLCRIALPARVGSHLGISIARVDLIAIRSSDERSRLLT